MRAKTAIALVLCKSWVFFPATTLVQQWSTHIQWSNTCPMETCLLHANPPQHHQWTHIEATTMWRKLIVSTCTGLQHHQWTQTSGKTPCSNSPASTWKTMLWHRNICQGVKIWVLGGLAYIYIYTCIYICLIVDKPYIHMKWSLIIYSNITWRFFLPQQQILFSFQGALSEPEDAEAEDAVTPLEKMWIMRWPHTLRK